MHMIFFRRSFYFPKCKIFQHCDPDYSVTKSHGIFPLKVHFIKLSPDLSPNAHSNPNQMPSEVPKWHSRKEFAVCPLSGDC